MLRRSLLYVSSFPLHPRRRRFHASRFNGVEATQNHYERLNVRHDASPAEIKRSFYALSKTHHPDANPTGPRAGDVFALLSESYTVLSDPPRRAAYDRDVLRLHQHQHHLHHHHASSHRGSYASTSSTHHAGGRPPSGLSRRRTSFRGPPPSFYRNGGWGAHEETRRRAHEESTSSASSSSSAHANPWSHAQSPFRPHDAPPPPPHFDEQSHARTHQREDRRRWQRQRRAVGDDDVEFEPQTSLAGHFLIVAGILGATFLAPLVYLQFVRWGRRKTERP
ncbi:hypothetical protein RJ55_02221 [Drechmeria coniospora]|nr:hypothetical protein RJ55_02221 [Drechmeria coniospora]